VIDDFNREGSEIEVDFSLPSECMLRTLDHIIEYRGKPDSIRCDDGPKYISVVTVQLAKNMAFKFSLFSPTSRRKVRMWNAIAELSVTSDWRTIYLKQWKKFRKLPQIGYEHTITNDLTWVSTARYQNRNSPLPLQLYF
jgi:hypothetical protein